MRSFFKFSEQLSSSLSLSSKSVDKKRSTSSAPEINPETGICRGHSHAVVASSDIHSSPPLGHIDQKAKHEFFKKNKLYKKHRDSHNHLTNYSMTGKLKNGEVTAPYMAQIFRDQIARMKETNTRSTVVAPIPLKQKNTTFIGDSPKTHRHEENEPSCCGCSIAPDIYYMDQKRLKEGKDPAPKEGLYLYSAIDSLMASAYKKLRPREKKYFDMMITGVNPTDDDGWEHIRNMLAEHKGVFKGVGEFTIHKEFVNKAVDGKPASLKHKGLDNIFQFCGQVGIVANMHCDVYTMPENATLADKTNLTAEDRAKIKQGENDAEKAENHWDDIKTMFRRHPETMIQWSHGGLGRYAGPRSDYLNELKNFLNDDTLKHVRIDISWDKVAAHINKDSETLHEWANILNEHPDRFLFGSDALTPLNAECYGKTYVDYHDLRSLLKPGVEEMIFNKTHKAMFEKAEANRDSWERAGCPDLHEDAPSGLYRPTKKTSIGNADGLAHTDTPAQPSRASKLKHDFSHPARSMRTLREKAGSILHISNKLSNKGIMPSLDGKERISGPARTEKGPLKGTQRTEPTYAIKPRAKSASQSELESQKMSDLLPKIARSS